MRNIEFIDGAMNATYDVFQATDEEFAAIFIGNSDVEFIDDLIARVGEAEAQRTLEPIWSRRIDKRAVQRIHGTLFLELDFKKKYYPNKRDSD